MTCVKNSVSGFRSARSLALFSQNVSHESGDRQNFNPSYGYCQPPPPAERKPAKGRHHRWNSDDEIRSIHAGFALLAVLRVLKLVSVL
jgi:hypothetical protein